MICCEAQHTKHSYSPLCSHTQSDYHGNLRPNWHKSSSLNFHHSSRDSSFLIDQRDSYTHYFHLFSQTKRVEELPTAIRAIVQRKDARNQNLGHIFSHQSHHSTRLYFHRLCMVYLQSK